MQSARCVPRSSSSRLSFIAILFLTSLVMAGCGGTMPNKAPLLSGNTEVTVMVTGTANDQLTEFDLGFQNINLTSQTGKTVTLLSLPASGPLHGSEFVHLNGNVEPLVTASIPQDVYTSASVTLGGAEFVCVQLVPGQNGQPGVLATSVFDGLGTAASTVTVNLPSPITVTGSSMALALNLLVAQSAMYSSCYDPNGAVTYSITPTFNLSVLNNSSSATKGKVVGLDGRVTAVAANGLTLSVPDPDGPRPLSVNSDSNTVYQGISGFSALNVGMFVDMDGAIQSDGSVRATRIAIQDPSAVEIFRGPLTEVTPAVSAVLMVPREQQGSGFDGGPGVGTQFVDFGDASFRISGQLANLGSLPFVPAFSSSAMVPGQEVYFSSDTNAAPAQGYPPVATMTLMPQTINGTITAASQVGNFTDYTVSLASYDLFPMLAVQPGQTTVENNPSQVEVYVDSNTQTLNTSALTSGNTFRFYGLIFNDNGTLRMDCAQINDGVPFAPQQSASRPLERGQARTLRFSSPGGLQQMVTFVRSNL